MELKQKICCGEHKLMMIKRDKIATTKIIIPHTHTHTHIQLIIPTAHS